MGCAADLGADFISDVSRPDRAVAWSLCVFHRNVLFSGDGGGADRDCLDRDRLSAAEAAPARTRRVRRGAALRAKYCGGPMSDPAATGASPQRRSWVRSWPMALPLLAFAALAAIFWFRLGTGDPSRIPSALIRRPAPQTELPPPAGLVHHDAQVPEPDPAVV